MSKSKYNKIEEYIDQYISTLIPENLPRYSYIYHLQMAFVDLAVDNITAFGPFEHFYNFSLSANIYWAYKKLKEENNFNFEYDNQVHILALQNITLGLQYAILCEIFPKLYNGLAELKEIRPNHFEIIEKELPREHFIYMNEYSKRNVLSYILQMVCGKNEHLEDDDRAYDLLKHYSVFWSEQLNSSDFKNYSHLEWAGISSYFTLASLRRYINLYDKDFKIENFHPSNMVIKLSEKWKEYLPDFINSSYDTTKKVLDDFIYQDYGYGFYPKCLISDAPIIKTNNDQMFVNLFSILFYSDDTRYLNFLRKMDNERYMIIKDEMKERHIPLISELITKKYNVKNAISQNIKIPGQKEKKREVDLLFFDELTGVALYIEVKYFYNPFTISEKLTLDKELQKALNKIDKQLDAIKHNWNLLSSNNNFRGELTKIYGPKLQ